MSYLIDIDSLTHELGGYKERVTAALDDLEKQINDLHANSQPAGEVNIGVLREEIGNLPANTGELKTKPTEFTAALDDRDNHTPGDNDPPDEVDTTPATNVKSKRGSKPTPIDEGPTGE